MRTSDALLFLFAVFGPTLLLLGVVLVARAARHYRK